jgi:Mrp family chromosome partitioning ATPase/capsular polysaccharide biosynthesis protein
MNPIDPFAFSSYDVLDPQSARPPYEALQRFVRRHWRLCIVWIAAGSFIGVSAAALSPAQYTAHTLIVLQDDSSRPVGDAIRARNTTDPGYAETQMQVLQSDEVIGRMTEEKRLAEDDEFGAAAPGVYEKIRALMASIYRSAQAEGDTSATHRTMRRVQRALSIRRLGLSAVVEIGFTSRSPVRAAMIANAVAEYYIDGQRRRQVLSRQDESQYLQESLTELQQKIAASEQMLREMPLATATSGDEAKTRFREAQNKIDVYRALYNNLLQRAFTDSTSQVVSANARIIGYADPPTGRSWLRPLLLFAAAFVSAAVCGLLHAFRRHVKDSSVRTLDEVQQVCAPGRVDGVPKINRKTWVRLEPQCGSVQPVYASHSALLCSALSKLAIHLQGQIHQRKPRIISVVAPTSGAGTSAIAVHLAIMTARSQKKVLLVDANWQKPASAPPVLNPDSPHRLTETHATILPDPCRLDVLLLRPAKTISEVNAALSVVTTLQHLPTEYDCVIVDFHSLHDTADFEASAAVPKEVIVVAEAARTSEDQLRKVFQLVPRDQVIAVVLNKARLRPQHRTKSPKIT